ncbi:hypothetical protein CBS14141_003894 [Malassezia furfur]|nr:hypothetical protein CBS14141_003894 [Malassezia furfur]
MSAGGQDDSAASFIGALISLTSRSNMRYQGVLSNIDAAQATLALEKVRSWGTEGRCAAAGQPQDEVPGSEKVYDYIVFRAADVVDLRIDDPSPAQAETPAAAAAPSPAPAPAAPSPLATPAPAASTPHEHGVPSPMPYANMYASPHMYGMPPQGYGYNPYMQSPYSGMPPMPPHGAPYGAPPPHMRAFASPVPPAAADAVQPAAPSPAPAPAPAPSQAASQRSVDEAQSQLSGMQLRDAPSTPAAQPSESAAKTNEAAPKASAPSDAAASRKPARKAPAAADANGVPAARAADGPAAAPAASGAPEAAAPSLAAPAKQEASVQQRERPTVPGAPANKPVAHRDASLPAKEYDFESANARFEKELRGTGGAAPAKLEAIPAPNTSGTSSFYDKKSGFFDNISSDVKEHYDRRGQAEAGRQRQADERARNAQTFGDQAAHFQAGGGRGAGAGAAAAGAEAVGAGAAVGAGVVPSGRTRSRCSTDSMNDMQL